MRSRAVVKSYNTERGFGFAKLEGGLDDDVFVHVKHFTDGLTALRPGQRVLLDVRPSKKFHGKFEGYDISLA